jgi:hypothetical protein
MKRPKDLLTVVTAILYSGGDMEGAGPEGIQNCIEEAQRLIEAVSKYKRPRIDPAEAKKWDEFIKRKK